MISSSAGRPLAGRHLSHLRVQQMDARVRHRPAEAVRGGAEDMAVDEAVKDRLRALAGVTLH